MKSLVVAVMGLISLNCFASTPFEELETLYNKGVNATLTDFPMAKEVFAETRKPLQTISGFIIPSTVREKIQGGWIAAIVEVPVIIKTEQLSLPAMGPLFPEVPGVSSTTTLKQFLVSTPNLDYLKKVNSESISLTLKENHITQYAFEMDHGQASITEIVKEVILHTYFRINNGMVVGKNVEVENANSDFKTPSYSYYWVN